MENPGVIARGRWQVVLLLGLAPLVSIAQPAGKGPGAGPPPAMPVKAVAARLAPAIDEANAVGTLRADESIVIRPEIAGRIAEFRFEEGQGVRKGVLLATLDASEVRAQLASAAAQAQLDAQRLERAEDLRKKNFISQQALEEALSNRARSQANQREIEAKLAKTEIRAPFAGVAGLRQVSQGAYVAAGTDIARLEKIDQLKLDFRVPEAYLARLKPAQQVKVQVDAYPDEAFGGAIYAIEPAIDEATRTVVVRARVANSDLKLRPGMFGRVQLQLAVREKAVWIPEQAIVPRGQDVFVFRVANGKAELVKVQTGTRRVGEVEIRSGIAAGELVVTEGTQRIGPGSPVNVMGDAPKPAAAAPDKKG
jgi:membrane fusion protein (multidrug efflux system)